VTTRLPDLGRRGGGWVAAQAVLLAAIALSALVGAAWPAGWEVVGDAVAALLLALGFGLLVEGGRELGPALTPFPAPRAGEDTTTHGLYAQARHPIYGGVILLALGWSALFASVAGLVLTALLLGFFELKSRREEHWLVERDPAYGEYRRRVRRRFVPFVY
jgi:protein-S-isoprenylcysteine O-methyltransferase Ste14